MDKRLKGKCLEPMATLYMRYFFIIRVHLKQNIHMDEENYFMTVVKLNISVILWKGKDKVKGLVITRVEKFNMKAR